VFDARLMRLIKPVIYSFIHFAFPNFRKMGEFAVSIEHSKAKSVSALGGLRPLDPPTTGSAPGPRWGLRLDPRYRLALRALAMPPPCQILNTPLFMTYHWVEKK